MFGKLQLLALCGVVGTASAGSASIYLTPDYVRRYHVKMWEDYRRGFRREYDGEGTIGSEDHKRMTIFRDNLESVHKLVEANPDAAFGFNAYTDKDPKEWGDYMATEPFAPVDAALDAADYVKTATEADLDMEKPVPSEALLRYEVGHMKHQGKCRVGGLFGAVSGLEGLLLRGGSYRIASDQHLLSCVVKDCSCTENKGCSPRAVYHAIMQNGGDIVAESDYMYDSADGKVPQCKPASEVEGMKRSGTLKGFYTLPNNKDFLKRWIDQKGSFTASVANTGKWQLYQEGPMQSTCGEGAPSHAVTVYGYGKTNGVEWFQAKSSHGTAWGMQGAIRLNADANCLFDPIAPIVEPLLEKKKDAAEEL